MPEFKLNGNYSATYTPYQTDAGFVAKGVVRLRGKPVQIFEAYGRTRQDLEAAATLEAEEVHRQIMAREVKRAATRRTDNRP